MIKHLYTSVLLVILTFMSVSCIKEDIPECPSQFYINVWVNDRNYFNVDLFPEIGKLPENLPFKNYIGTVYYTLTNTETGDIAVESSVLNTGGNDAEFGIKFDNIPSGKYELTVWGNLNSQVTPGMLHPGNTEHVDLYMNTATLDFTSSPQTARLGLERAKGKLLVICKNFPSTITTIQQNINNVFSLVDSHFLFSGNTSVNKTSPLTQNNGTAIAPTVIGNTSKLNLSFYSADNSTTPVFTLPEIGLNIKRNEITPVTIDYNTSEGTLDIWLFVNGTWSIMHHLDFD